MAKTETSDTEVELAPLEAWEEKVRKNNSSMFKWLLLGLLSFPASITVIIELSRLPNSEAPLEILILGWLLFSLPPALLAGGVIGALYTAHLSRWLALERPTESSES